MRYVPNGHAFRPRLCAVSHILLLTDAMRYMRQDETLRCLLEWCLPYGPKLPDMGGERTFHVWQTVQR